MYIGPSYIVPVIAVLLVHILAWGYNALINREVKKGHLNSLPAMWFLVSVGVLGVITVFSFVIATGWGTAVAKDFFILLFALFASAGGPMAYGEYKRWGNDFEKIMQRLRDTSKNNLDEAEERLDNG